MKHPIATALSLTLIATVGLIGAQPAFAADQTAAMHKTTPEGIGDSIGTIAVADSAAGATFKLDLHGLPPGPHGFHVHENGNCDPTLMNGVRMPAGAAGSHMDPDHTSKHEGPTGTGHMGDLPALDVASNGTATQSLTAPRIKDASILKKHALIIHAGGDNYSDAPAALGGGGGRLACGVIE
jgi:Cu-Zn family superoxide dismutase